MSFLAEGYNLEVLLLGLAGLWLALSGGASERRALREEELRARATRSGREGYFAKAELAALRPERRWPWRVAGATVAAGCAAYLRWFAA